MFKLDVNLAAKIPFHISIAIILLPSVGVLSALTFEVRGTRELVLKTRYSATHGAPLVK